MVKGPVGAPMHLPLRIARYMCFTYSNFNELSLWKVGIKTHPESPGDWSKAMVDECVAPSPYFTDARARKAHAPTQ